MLDTTEALFLDRCTTRWLGGVTAGVGCALCQLDVAVLAVCAGVLAETLRATLTGGTGFGTVVGFADIGRFTDACRTESHGLVIGHAFESTWAGCDFAALGANTTPADQCLAIE